MSLISDLQFWQFLISEGGEVKPVVRFNRKTSILSCKCQNCYFSKNCVKKKPKAHFSFVISISLKSRGTILNLFSLNTDLVTLTSAEDFLIYSGGGRREVRTTELWGGTLTEHTLGEVSGPQFTVKVREHSSVTFPQLPGRMTAGWQPKLCGVCLLSPLREQLIAAPIG